MPEVYEIADWIGISIFEILMQLIGLFIFTILLAIRIEADERDEISMNWFVVFSPLYCADMICVYFGIIVSFRLYIRYDAYYAIGKFMWRMLIFLLVVLFKVLLCLKLEGTYELYASDVFVPLFLLLQILAVRSCQIRAFLEEAFFLEEEVAEHHVEYRQASEHEASFLEE